MEGFEPDEWELVRQAPWTVAIAVIEAGGGGPFHRRKEVAAILREVRATDQRATDQHGPSSALVSAVAAELAEASPDEPLAAVDDLDRGDLGAGVLARCRDIGAVLAARVAADEAAAFRTWLLALARGVAEAATEGGLAGLGGDPVSPAELDVLDDLAAALGPSEPLDRPGGGSGRRTRGGVQVRNAHVQRPAAWSQVQLGVLPLRGITSTIGTQLCFSTLNWPISESSSR